MQQEKALGKLKGISDVEAYRHIANYLFTTGIIVDNSKPKPTATNAVDTKTTDDTTLRDKKRRAVAPVKQTNSSKGKSEENFLGLSDDEFMKKFAGV